jgi:hypothetical protein
MEQPRLRHGAKQPRGRRQGHGNYDKPGVPDTNSAGIDAYMRGLKAFAQAVVAGSAREIASLGDERNALLMLTVEADLGGGKVTLPAARLYLLDEADEIKVEQVVFLVPD